jgi:anaerobic ribonucleoside-triphosphate reductase
LVKSASVDGELKAAVPTMQIVFSMITMRLLPRSQMGLSTAFSLTRCCSCGSRRRAQTRRILP